MGQHTQGQAVWGFKPSFIVKNIFPDVEHIYHRGVMYIIGQAVQIINHAQPECNLQYGVVTHIERAYSGTMFYTVQLESFACSCTEDELMEG
jgi:hypothetical protein